MLQKYQSVASNLNIQKRMPSLRRKAEGNVLVFAFAISAMIMTLGLGLLKVLGTELKFAADLLQSEQAHFAAESGIEQSLLWLNSEPLEHLVAYDPQTENPEHSLGDNISQEITILNDVPEVTFALGPEQGKQIVLKKDPDGNALLPNGDVLERISSLNVRAEAASPSNGQANTYELNICLGSPANELRAPVSAGSDQTISNDLEDHCIVQVYNQNLASEDPETSAERTLYFTLTSAAGLSPHRAEIKSRGIAGDREKIITFGLEENKTIFNRNLFVQ